MLPGRSGTASERTHGLRLGLAAVIAAIVLAHFVVLAIGSGLDVDTRGLLAPFDLFQERSVGTWFNALLLLAVAVAAGALAMAAPAGDRRLRRGWAALAVLLALASLDEVAGVHESLVHVLRSAFELPGALLHASWVVPAVALLAAFAAWQWRFFRLLPGWLGRRFGLAVGAYVAAAVGLEMVESAILTARGGQDSDWTGILQVLVGIEEGVEMAAAAVMLLLLLRHLAEQAPEWRIRVAASGAPDRGAEHLHVAPIAPGEPAPVAERADPRFRRAAVRERRPRQTS